MDPQPHLEPLMDDELIQEFYDGLIQEFCDELTLCTDLLVLGDSSVWAIYDGKFPSQELIGHLD